MSSFESPLPLPGAGESETMALHRHRFKNYQQMVSSLMSLQLRRVSGEEAKRALEDLRARVDIASMLHGEFLDAESQNSHADTHTVVSSIVARVGQSYDPFGRHRVMCDAQPIRLKARRASILGQILAELLINVYRHGFAGREQGGATVELRRLPDGRIELRVADDGPGEVAGMEENLAEGTQKSRLGLALVGSLSRSLSGNFRKGNAKGFAATVTFPEHEEAGTADAT